MKSVLTKKTNHAFLQMTSVAVLVFAAISFFSLKIYEQANVYIGVLYHHIRAACGCTDVVQFLNMHPVIFAEVSVLAVAISSFFIFAIHKFLKLYFSTRGFTKHCLSHAMKKHSWKLKSVFVELGIDKGRIMEIRGQDAAVFCYGLLRPKICISSYLVKMLDRGELRSVLLHEKHHMEGFEPLKYFIVMYLTNIFFILPGIKKLAKKYFTFSEMSADEAASCAPYGTSKLARAMFKISESGSSGDMSSLAISERVNRLVDGGYIPNFRNLRKSFTACFVIFSFVSIYTFSILSKSTEAYEMHSGGICAQNGEKEYDFAGALMSDESACNMHPALHLDAGECKAE